MVTGDDPTRSIEWDSEILNDEPGKRIAWRSIGGDSDNAGEVIFETGARRPRNHRYGAAGVSHGQTGKRVGDA